MVCLGVRGLPGIQAPQTNREPFILQVLLPEPHHLPLLSTKPKKVIPRHSKMWEGLVAEKRGWASVNCIVSIGGSDEAPQSDWEPHSFVPSSAVSLPDQSPQHKHHCVFTQSISLLCPLPVPVPHSEVEVLQRNPWISTEACWMERFHHQLFCQLISWMIVYPESYLGDRSCSWCFQLWKHTLVKSGSSSLGATLYLSWRIARVNF